MKYIAGFFKGMISKKAGSKLDEEYRQKASELINFYNDNNTVITRRPPSTRNGRHLLGLENYQDS